MLGASIVQIFDDWWKIFVAFGSAAGTVFVAGMWFRNLILGSKKRWQKVEKDLSSIRDELAGNTALTKATLDARRLICTGLARNEEVMCLVGRVGFITDANDLNVFTTPEYQSLLGATKSQLSGTGWRSFIDAADVGRVMSLRTDAMRERRAVSFETTLHPLRESGPIRVRIAMEPKFRADGEYIGHVGVIDIIHPMRVET